MARRSCKPFSKAALRRGTAVEHREHPGFTKREAERIARDHLCAKGDRAYPPGGHRFGFGERYTVHVKRARGAGGIYGKPIHTMVVEASSPDAAMREVKRTWEKDNPPRYGRRWGYETAFSGFVPGRKVPPDFGGWRDDAKGWGRFKTPRGVVVTMYRGKRNHVRFYTRDGRQVGPEQANVAPAVAYALSHGWKDFWKPT